MRYRFPVRYQLSHPCPPPPLPLFLLRSLTATTLSLLFSPLHPQKGGREGGREGGRGGGREGGNGSAGAWGRIVWEREGGREGEEGREEEDGGGGGGEEVER